jgi:4-hydroxy-tetrahydrodipicolinate reductase
MNHPAILIAGSGKLARELLTGLAPDAKPWSDRSDAGAVRAVVHAGSGRELPEILLFCRERALPLIELSTGTGIADLADGVPVVVCANANLLMLKFMAMLARCGPWFHGEHVRLTESHQAGKTSVPGTAVAMAASLGLSPEAIVSVRDPAQQSDALGVPATDLGRHAFHRIEIGEGDCRLRLETLVTGGAPYAEGVRRIVDAALAYALEPRCHDVVEFIDKGWL